jgi:hypothetical protein
LAIKKPATKGGLELRLSPRYREALLLRGTRFTVQERSQVPGAHKRKVWGCVDYFFSVIFEAKRTRQGVAAPQNTNARRITDPSGHTTHSCIIDNFLPYRVK